MAYMQQIIQGMDQADVDVMTGTMGMGHLIPKQGEFLKQEPNLQTRTPIKEDINLLEALLRPIRDGETLEGVENLAASPADDFVAATSTVDPCLDDVYKGRPLFGIHELTGELQSMMSSSHQLKIVSIWGPGGMGKTTLANAMYQNIKRDFHCSAFVCVGRQPDLKNVLRNILIDLGNEVYRDLNMTILNERQLIDELRHFLQSKRFLIVIDDIWDVPAWEVIKSALVDGGCGSRIITTSRKLDVLKGSGEVFELMPLSIDDSKKLFHCTLVGHKGINTFYPLDEQSTEYILQKCGGVPLAIIIMASLLTDKPQEEWSKLYNSIEYVHEDNIDLENTRKIIRLGFYDLPAHLKTCLFFFGTYPEDYLIEKDTLIWRWIDEGLVHAQQDESLYKIAERYFYELISRSMIQPTEHGHSSMIFACRIHDMVHDLIKLEVTKHNFVNKAYGIDDAPTIDVGLHHLRYLDLTNANIEALPHSITLLRELKALWCSGLMLELPKGMGNLTSLEILQLGTVAIFPNSANELSKLTELRVLRISIENLSFEEEEALVESLSKLKKIQNLVLIFDGPGSDEPCLHVISPSAFPKLQYLQMNYWLMYQLGAMPCLRCIELCVDVWAFNDANFDFHDFYRLRYLRLLEKVHVAVFCWEATMMDVEEAEATLRRVIQHHPNHPKLILERFGLCADDKLYDFNVSGSGSTQSDVDNKQIREKLQHSRVVPEVMPLEMLKKITKGFSKKREVGSGTFGTVYKGVHIGKDIAVKLLHRTQRPDYEEDFRKELENIRRLKHPNIIQLLGYCYEIKRELIEYEGRPIFADNIYRALCFEYMHNGSLQGHLNDEVNRLDWWTCYKIIKGTCEGLKYLHEGLKTPMYHLDLKPGNILLDKNMVPKIADFGLSKLVLDNETRSTSSFLGTRRYCPPEYINHGYVSNKFDIFSLGVVMIDIIAGSEGYSKAAEMPSQEFIDHVQENWRKRLQATPGCASPINECRQVQRCSEIALDCVLADRKRRPNIGDIISRLNEVEDNAEKSATTFASQNRDMTVL